MKVKHKGLLEIILCLIISISIAITILFIIKNKANEETAEYKECQSIAIIHSTYHKVYATAKEDEVNYEYYYKSIMVKEEKDKYIVIVIDWRTETEEELVFDKSKCVVIISY